VVQPAVRYENSFMNSARWSEITLREGDIVISTPPKCGTTWMQMICALLVFQTTDFPQPLPDMSLWVDFRTPSRADLRAAYGGQSHRRFLKTHTPLDGLPIDDRVSYICVGRDPRDAAISWLNHLANQNVDALTALLDAAAIADGERATSPREIFDAIPPGTLNDQFVAWVDNPDQINGLAWFITHMASFWEARDRPNVALLHYDALQADLADEMRSLAKWLHIDVAPQRWDQLVTAAGFDWMSRRFDLYAPGGPVWRDQSRFFHKGTSGQWRDVLDPAGLNHYWTRIPALADPELVAWLHPAHSILPTGARNPGTV